MGILSNFLQNKLVDLLLRGQAYTPPSTVYVGLMTTLETAGGAGVEVTGGSYARTAVAATLSNWAGTQGAGTTAVSSGTTGTTSNNNPITFPTPTGNWGDVVGIGIFDAASGGDLLMFGPLTAAKNVNNGDPAPVFSAAALALTFG